MVDWAEGNQTLLDAIHDLSVMTLKWENGIGLFQIECCQKACSIPGLSPVDGVDFNTELPRIRGGPILWKMVGNMLDKLKCEKKMNAVLRVDPDLGGFCSSKDNSDSLHILKEGNHPWEHHSANGPIR